MAFVSCLYSLRAVVSVRFPFGLSIYKHLSSVRLPTPRETNRWSRRVIRIWRDTMTARHRACFNNDALYQRMEEPPPTLSFMMQSILCSWRRRYRLRRRALSIYALSLSVSVRWRTESSSSMILDLPFPSRRLRRRRVPRKLCLRLFGASVVTKTKREPRIRIAIVSSRRMRLVWCGMAEISPTNFFPLSWYSQSQIESRRMQ